MPENQPYQPDDEQLRRRAAFKKRNGLHANIALGVFMLVLFAEWRADPVNGMVQRNINAVEQKLASVFGIQLELSSYWPLALVVTFIVIHAIGRALFRLVRGSTQLDAAMANDQPASDPQNRRRQAWQYMRNAAEKSHDDYLASASYRANRTTDWLQSLVFVVCGLGLAAYYFYHPAGVAPQPSAPQAVAAPADQNPNSLPFAAMPQHAFTVPIIRPIDLSTATKAQILAARLNVMHRYDQAYRPFEPIFAGIQDRLPWWGVYGLQFYGSGERAGDGPSFRATSLLNPLALVWPSLWEQTFHNAHLWHPDKIAAVPAEDKAFPLQADGSLTVDPASRTIELHLQAARYNAALAPYLRLAPGNKILLNMEAVNARDLGYPYLYLDAAQSRNLSHAMSEIFLQDVEYYHVGGSCGIPGGCNNLSPRQEALAGFVVTDLPAVATFKLWHNPPADPRDAAADVTYRIYFE